MRLKNIGIWIVISGSKHHVVHQIKFNTNLVEYIVLATTNDPEWYKAHNMAKDSNH
jgi:hypothetical protein